MNNSLDVVKKIANHLIVNKLNLITVESCTGGLIAAKFTDLPGSSDWFLGGLVTYSNFLKERLASVNPKSIVTHGAVSEIVAKEMAAGGRKFADVSISVTGIAGPGGGSQEKPVGTVCFAYQGINFAKTETCKFAGDRAQIREQATEHAINAILAKLSSI